MIVKTQVRFRALREPFAYDMTAQGGSVGTSYSFDAMDDDESKVKVKCSQATYEQLKSAKRDDVIECFLEVGNPKVAPGTPVQVHQPAKG